MKNIDAFDAALDTSGPNQSRISLESVWNQSQKANRNKSARGNEDSHHKRAETLKIYQIEFSVNIICCQILKVHELFYLTLSFLTEDFNTLPLHFIIF